MNNKRDNFPWVLIIGIAILIMAAYIAHPFVLRRYIDSIDNRGLFGDSYGVLTSLFGAVTIILLIITLIYQKKEYKKTLEEMELSRKAQEESKDALSKQAETLKFQRFENTFFKLFEIHLNICNELSFASKDKGKKAFSILSHHIYNMHLNNPKTIKEDFGAFHDYTNNLKNIFSFIDTECPNKSISERKKYFGFILGQFTAAEWKVFNYYMKNIDKEIETKFIQKYNLSTLNPAEYHFNSSSQ